MGGAEVMAGLAVDEFFTDLADDHPFMTLPAQQRPEAFLTAAIGRRGVDQVDPQVARELEQHACFVIIRDLKTTGVFHPLVTAQLDGAQPQRGHRQAGTAQRAMQVVQGRLAHGSSCSQGVWPSGGRGSSGRAGA